MRGDPEKWFSFDNTRCLNVSPWIRKHRRIVKGRDAFHRYGTSGCRWSEPTVEITDDARGVEIVTASRQLDRTCRSESGVVGVCVAADEDTRQPWTSDTRCDTRTTPELRMISRTTSRTGQLAARIEVVPRGFLELEKIDERPWRPCSNTLARNLV